MLRMSRTSEEQLVIEQFARLYPLGQSGVMRKIERAVCGCEYGSTSWTTREEAQKISTALALDRNHRLLDLGAGSGWPGLYFATITGCGVVLVDVPLAGLRIAAERAAIDRVSDRCGVAAADGAALPFQNGCFDTISHSDVLCCLTAKLPVLQDCRRVIRTGGRMVFTVISIAPGLPAADHKRAIKFGPPFVESIIPYPAMLHEAGWQMTDCTDLTAEYEKSVSSQLRAEEAHAHELSELLGETECSERLARRRGTVRAIKDRILRREMFTVAALTISVASDGN
jgi:ubiquinone/menaquinone biosynthesis C-methylase UbiE